MQLLRRIASMAVVVLLASAASADPILTVSTDSIALSPTTTVITFEIDPNGTALSGVVLSFSALASGLAILDVSPVDAEVAGSGPQLSGSDWLGGFLGVFAVDRTNPFVVGTLTLEGLAHGTPLVLTGNYTDGSFINIPIPATDIAIVNPEPGSLVLLGLGLIGLTASRRSRVR